MAARERIGKQALSFNPDEWTEWLRFKDIVGAVDPLTVAREWLAWRQRVAAFVRELLSRLDKRRHEDSGENAAYDAKDALPVLQGGGELGGR